MKAHIARILAAGLLLGLVSTHAFGVSGGLTGRTNKSGGSGCAGCHGASADPTLTVTISGPSALNAGQAGTYTVTATKSVANGTKMGLNVASSDSNPLTAIGGQCTDVASEELKHNVAVCALKTTTSNSASYQFTYTMPAAASGGSTHTLYAVSALGFLGWNHAPNFTVTTRPPAPSTLTPSNLTPTTVDFAWTGGGPEYRLVYKTGATPPANETDGTQINSAGLSTPVTGLSPSTQYSFRVFSKLTAQSIFSSTGPSQTLTTPAIVAATRYVNAATGVNSGTCNVQASPCKTITYAMQQAVAGNPGDLVSVAPGTYNLALGEVFPITFKNGVQLLATGNPSNTIIDAAGDTVKDGIINSTGNTSSSARIEGFTLRNGLKTPSNCGSPLGGALYISGSSGTFTVTRNVFAGNESRGFSADGSGGETGCLAWGGAIAVFSSTVNITNNVFRGNVARGGNGFTNVATPKTNKNGGQGNGGAIYFAGSGSITNNTFHGNTAVGGNGGTGSDGVGNGGPAAGGAIMASGNPAPSVINNILSANSASRGSGGTAETAESGAMFVNAAAPVVTKNLFFANLVNGAASTGDTIGTASVTGDPQFHAAPTDLHILPSSPAAGAGTATGAPAADHDGVTRANPPAIGAFEPTAIPVANPPRLSNISTRMQVLTGNDVMIGGFVIGGSANKTVVVRARGPSLIPFGIPNALANPQLQLVRSSDQQTIATNDDWQSAANAGDITASGFAPSNNLEAAILMSLPPGGYTAIVTGVGNGTGVGIVEVFEVDGPSIPLANISTRGQVLTGNDVMIGGFVVTGTGPQTVVVRARGPSLVPFGITNALANPQLQLVRSSDQSQIAFNDDWQSAGNAAQVTASGFAPSNNLEAAILISLQPGAYTAIVTGVGGGTGVGIVEVFTTP